MELGIKLTHLAGVALVVASLSACGSLPRDGEATPVEAVAAATAPAPAAEQDDRITQSVRDSLAREVPLADIDVRTAQGKVALTGTVEDGEDARRAVKGALAVEGVRGVVNDLSVDPEAAQGAALSASTR